MDQDFKSLATQSVLSDSDSEEARCAKAAADALQAASNVRLAIAEWAASINTWMPGGGRSDGDTAMLDVGESQEAESDVIARAKALGFLAKTLEFTKADLLKPQQIELLISFFGILFSADHKAGISAATKALQHLSNMKNFKPPMGDAILGHIVKLKDDFRLQTPITRFEIYQLVDRLLSDPAILVHLQDKQDDPNRPIKYLLQLCSHERDPKNLIKFFGILEVYLKGPLVTPEVAQEIFTAHSAYFPISMRSSTTSSGVTVTDLKTALRGCFKASHLAAASVFDFLLKKLDQGNDSVSVTVKVDVLDTITASAQSFSDPLNNVLPHVTTIWDSIKYEIRHGDVDEVIASAVQTLRAIIGSIDSDDQPAPLTEFEGFLENIRKWCTMDLASSTYLRSAILILACVSGATPRAFYIMTDRIVGEIDRNFLQNGREVEQGIAFLNVILRNRQTLIETNPATHRDIESLYRHDPLFNGILNTYLRVWNSTRTATQGPELTSIYKELMRGFAEIIRQTKQGQPPESNVPLYSADDRQRIVDLLSEEFIPDLTSQDSAGLDEDVAAEAVQALKAIVELDSNGFSRVLGKAFAAIFQVQAIAPSNGQWDPSFLQVEGLKVWGSRGSPIHQDLQTMLKRLAYMGCSAIAAGSDPLCNMIELLQYLTSSIVFCIDHNGDLELCEDLLVGLYSTLLNIHSTIALRNLEEPTPTQQTSFWESFTNKYPLSQDATKAVQDIKLPDSSAMLAGEQSSSSMLILQVQALGLYILQVLHPRAQDIVKEENKVNLLQHKCLNILASIIAFVTSKAGETGQLTSQLHQKVFGSSSTDKASLFNNNAGGCLEIITKGYLQGIRPAVLIQMVDYGFQPVDLLSDLHRQESVSSQAKRIRDLIAMLVANKFGGPGHNEQQQQAWTTAVESMKKMLGSGNGSLTHDEFLRLLHITTGGIARLDAGAKQVAPLLFDAAVHHSDSHPARSLDRLAFVSDVLNDKTHAVTRKLYKQWLYHNVVSPNLSRAFPLSADSQESRHAALAALAILRHMPVAVYTNDIAAIVRIAITAIGAPTAGALPEPYDVALGLHVLNEIVDADAAYLKGHIKKIVQTTAEIIQIRGPWPTASQPSRTDSKLGKGAYCRNLATTIICKLPAHQHELGLLVTYKPLVSRVLRMVSGDPAREIRELANEGREDWENIS